MPKGSWTTGEVDTKRVQKNQVDSIGVEIECCAARRPWPEEMEPSLVATVTGDGVHCRCCEGQRSEVRDIRPPRFEDDRPSFATPCKACSDPSAASVGQSVEEGKTKRMRSGWVSCVAQTHWPGLGVRGGGQGRDGTREMGSTAGTRVCVRERGGRTRAPYRCLVQKRQSPGCKARPVGRIQ